ncbi:MAG: hypothetical protein WAW96_04470 [Alphaproteobacteria bacterium]
MAAAILVLIAFYAFALSFISPSLVIAKLQADCLNYFTQAQYLARHGTLKGLSFGDGTGLLVYAPIAGYVRAPLFLISHTIDITIRAIQVENVVFLALVGLLSWEYLRLRLPAQFSRAWCLVPFVWLCMVYMPWFYNAYMPASDHIFAVWQLAFIALCLHSEWWLRTAPRGIAFGLLLLVLLVIAAIQKFTALALLAYAFVLFVERYRPPLRVVIAGGLAALAFAGGAFISLSALYMTYVHTGIVHGFLGKPIERVVIEIALTFFASFLPAQIIPNFSYIFMRVGDPTLPLELSKAHLEWIPGILIGFAISAMILRGAWASRRSTRPELAMLFLTVPIYAAVTQGGGGMRYLAYMQPTLLLYFLVGAEPIWKLLQKRLGGALPYLATAAAASTAIVTVASLGTSVMASPVKNVRDFVRFFSQLDHDYSETRKAIDAVAGPHTRFLDLVVGNERWNPIAGVTYIRPDLATSMICHGYMVYAELDCDRRNCPSIKQTADESLHQVLTSQPLNLVTVYEEHTEASEAMIKRLELRNPSTACRAE